MHIGFTFSGSQTVEIHSNCANPGCSLFNQNQFIFTDITTSSYIITIFITGNCFCKTVRIGNKNIFNTLKQGDETNHLQSVFVDVGFLKNIGVSEDELYLKVKIYVTTRVLIFLFETLIFFQ